MNKKVIVPIIIALLFLIVAVVFSCGGGKKVSLQWESVPPSRVSVDSVELNVYVENSGSMDGYMCPGSNLKDAVFDYVSDLRKECATISLFYINSQVIPCKQSLEDYIQNLTPASFSKAGGNRADTDLRQIIQQILQKQKKNGAGEIFRG